VRGELLVKAESYANLHAAKFGEPTGIPEKLEWNFNVQHFLTARSDPFTAALVCVIEARSGAAAPGRQLVGGRSLRA
jgi:hypothetical protein